MKKAIYFLIFIQFYFVFSQVPNQLSYQGVLRGESGELLSNTDVGVKISILKDNETSTAIYSETHNVQTNINGLMSLFIGAGNTLAGNFSLIDWSTGKHFVKVETDTNGGTSYNFNSHNSIIKCSICIVCKK